MFKFYTNMCINVTIRCTGMVISDNTHSHITPYKGNLVNMLASPAYKISGIKYNPKLVE